jgi:hypothetical protein
VDAVRKLIVLRVKYEDVSSAKIKAAVDEFVDVISKDLEDGEHKSNDTTEFHSAAQRRLREPFDKLNSAIVEAMRFEELPIQ